MGKEIDKLTATRPVFAGEYFRAYNDLPADACIGERDISVREIVDKINELIERLNKLEEKQ